MNMSILIILVVGAFLIMPVLKKNMDLLNEKQKNPEKWQIKQYFAPEKRIQEMQKGTGIGTGKVAGGTANALFGVTGGIIKMIPGMGFVGSAVGHTGKLVSKGMEAGGNALDNAAKSAEFQKVKSGNVERGISDADFDAIVKNHVPDLKQRALDILSLDETQITELPPVCLEDYYIDENNENQLVARGKDGIDRTSSYQVTWLFFTAKQLCIYQYITDILTDSKQETTEEYFWKDVTNLTNSNETVNGNEQRYFVIKVSGGDYKCVYKDNAETKRAIQGMKTYFRDIKSV